MGDDAAGEYVSEKVYDDAKVEDIEAIPNQSHRPLDAAIAEADYVEGEQSPPSPNLSIFRIEYFQ